MFPHLDELGDEELLDLVQGEEPGGLFVEPVALLHHEGAGGRSEIGRREQRAESREQRAKSRGATVHLYTVKGREVRVLNTER